MKKIFLTAALLILAQNALADKIVISGQPVVVTPSGNYYALPSDTTYTPSSDYYYVTVNNSQRVCYREVQPALASVNPTNMSLRIGGETVAVRCYDYSPDYFTVQQP